MSIERQNKINEMLSNFKKSAPLERYVIYMTLKKMGVYIPYDY